MTTIEELKEITTRWKDNMSINSNDSMLCIDALPALIEVAERMETAIRCLRASVADIGEFTEREDGDLVNALDAFEKFKQDVTKTEGE
jgi:hypothetical protein